MPLCAFVIPHFQNFVLQLFNYSHQLFCTQLLQSYIPFGGDRVFIRVTTINLTFLLFDTLLIVWYSCYCSGHRCPHIVQLFQTLQTEYRISSVVWLLAVSNNWSQELCNGISMFEVGSTISRFNVAVAQVSICRAFLKRHILIFITSLLAWF